MKDYYEYGTQSFAINDATEALLNDIEVKQLHEITWIAQINGDDKMDREKIRIGISKINNEKYPHLKYDLVSDNGDDVSTGGEKSYTNAIDAISKSWGHWNTFKWLENYDK